MNELLPRRCPECVDLQELFPESPSLRADPDAAQTNVELARPFTIVHLKTNPTYR
jgi:hypothetical protein